MSYNSTKNDDQESQNDFEGIMEDSYPFSHSHDESNWLVSYADMMTLLCGFFIMIFSMSKIDQIKYERMQQQLAKDFHQEYISTPKDLEQSFKTMILSLGVEKSANVRSDALGVAITFESAVFFQTLSAEVSPKGKEILTQIIESIRSKQNATKQSYKIIVEGHTDARPILGGIYPSNWELSGARAAGVIRLFLNHGFRSDHLTAIGYADTYPVEASKTADGKWNEIGLSKNRRVVVRVLEASVDSIPFPGGFEDGSDSDDEPDSSINTPKNDKTLARPSANTAH